MDTEKFLVVGIRNVLVQRFGRETKQDWQNLTDSMHLFI